MKKWLLSGLLSLMIINSYSKNLDLVVTISGDSIACKIDSITESAIYLQFKTSGNVDWIQTIYNKEDIHIFKYGNIDPSKYEFKEGTSIIIGSTQPVYPKKFPDKLTLKNAENMELDFYLEKAYKTKKRGKVMAIAGPLAAAAGGIFVSTSFKSGGSESGYRLGSFLFFTGIISTLVGLPTLITGSSRVKNIIEIKNSRGMAMEFAPAGNYNFQANSYQPGITLRIRF